MTRTNDTGRAGWCCLVALGLAAAAGLHAGAAAARNVPDEVGQLPDRNWEARCSMLGRMFERLGELRDAGAERNVAAGRVAQWAGRFGGVGSHVVIDYAAAAEAASHYVYQQKALNPASLRHWGYRSCGLEYRFEQEPLRIEAGQNLLFDAVQACQKAHPGEEHNRPLRDCIAQRSEAIAERVAKARIKVKP